MEIGNRLELSVSKSMQKSELQRKIIEHMVDEDIFGEDSLIDVPDDTAKMTEAHIEQEKTRLQAKVEIARLEQELSLAEANREHKRDGFDITKQIRLVSRFLETDVDEYFAHFERTAINMK